MTAYARMRPDRAAPRSTHNKVVIDHRNIDDFIAGFRTLNVAGRETLSFDLETTDRAGGQHGSHIQSKKLPARIINVEYQMTADSSNEFQIEYIRLMQLLMSDDDVMIEFTDMPGFCFFGQVTGFDEVPPHSNQITSSFDIYCQDPFLYDAQETALSTVNNTLRMDYSNGFYEINNMGTAPARFKFYNESLAENGYLGIVTDDQYYSIGDPEEADKIPLPESKLVIDEEMDNMNAWEHNTVQPPASDCHATGGFKETKYGSTVSDIIPTPVDGKTWYGPSAIRRFYTDELNENFADSFHAKFRLAAQSSSPGRQTFRTIIGILDQDKNFMFWLDMRDGSSRYANNHMRMYHNATGSPTIVTQNDGRMNNYAGNFQIQKDGNRVKYRLYHIKEAGYGYLADQASGGWSFDRTINQPQWDASGRVASYVYVWAGRPLDEEVYDHLELSQTRVLKKYWNGDGNITNILAQGDIFNLDTNTGRAYLLESYRDAGDTAGQGAVPMSEAINPGSDVALELRPGINHLYVDRSSWYGWKDEVTIVFRQRYY